MWYFSFWLRSLAPYRSRMATAQMRRATRPMTRVLRIQAVGEEERQVGREVVDVHAAGQVVLHVGEAVGQGERQLARSGWPPPRRCGSR